MVRNLACGYELVRDSFDKEDQKFKDVIKLIRDSGLGFALEEPTKILEAEILELFNMARRSNNGTKIKAIVRGVKVRISAKSLSKHLYFPFHPVEDEWTRNDEEMSLLMANYQGPGKGILRKAFFDEPYKLLVDIVGKCIFCKEGSHDSISKEMFRVMGSIMLKKKFNFGQFFFERLKTNLNNPMLGRILTLYLCNIHPKTFLNKYGVALHGMKKISPSIFKRWTRVIGRGRGRVVAGRQAPGRIAGEMFLKPGEAFGSGRDAKEILIVGSITQHIIDIPVIGGNEGAAKTVIPEEHVISSDADHVVIRENFLDIGKVEPSAPGPQEGVRLGAQKPSITKYILKQEAQEQAPAEEQVQMEEEQRTPLEQVMNEKEQRAPEKIKFREAIEQCAQIQKDSVSEGVVEPMSRDNVSSQRADQEERRVETPDEEFDIEVMMRGYKAAKSMSVPSSSTAGLSPVLSPIEVRVEPQISLPTATTIEGLLENYFKKIEKMMKAQFDALEKRYVESIRAQEEMKNELIIMFDKERRAMNDGTAEMIDLKNLMNTIHQENQLIHSHIDRIFNTLANQHEIIQEINNRVMNMPNIETVKKPSDAPLPKRRRA